MKYIDKNYSDRILFARLCTLYIINNNYMLFSEYYNNVFENIFFYCILVICKLWLFHVQSVYRILTKEVHMFKV